MKITRPNFLPTVMVASTVCLLTLILWAKLSDFPGSVPTLAQYEKTGQAVTEEWLKKDFNDLASPDFASQLKTFVAGATSQAALPAAQGERLAGELAAFFRAYSQGNYAAYQRFRFPPGTAHGWKTNKFGSLDTVLLHPPGFGGLSTYHRWKAAGYSEADLAGKSAEEKFGLYLQCFSGPGIYSNYFRGVSFSDSKLVINIFTNPAPEPWVTPFWTNSINQSNRLAAAKQFPNLGFLTHKKLYSLVRPEVDLASLQAQAGSVCVADFYFLIKREVPDTVLPVIIRYFWNPANETWVPDDLVVCNLWHLSDFSYWPYF